MITNVKKKGIYSDMDKKFNGMMITLKKRMVCINQDDTKTYRYLMFGHYDGMDIVCTDQWYQLRPKGVADIGGNVDIGDNFGDKYTLKLYFPDVQCCQKLEHKGFAYDVWYKLGCHNNDSKECNNILERSPFISVAMINLSEKCVKIQDNLIETMQSVIARAAKETGGNLSDIHCAIMPSVGYADFVLLFLSDNLKKVITILDYLRKERIVVEGKSYAMLSNSYAISGFAREGLNNLHNLPELDKVKLSLRVNLRDGVSASQFKSYFDKELDKVFKIREIQKEEQSTKLYQVFGNSDCLILSDMPFDFFVPLFYDGNLLNPEHELFEKYIQHTRSSVRVGIDAEEDFHPLESDTSRIYREYQQEFQDIIDILKKFVKESDIPIRGINGLQTVMKAYLGLVQFSHCFDIKEVIGDAFKAMSANVKKTIEIISDLEDAEESCWYSEQMMDALKIFREKIEDYLADLRRSDRLFIEGESLSHPSIGSATKLLFFYNHYINDMAASLVETEESEQKPRFTFVVTSGGCDVTTAYDLFSYLDPADEVECSLIIISVPEMSLYDFRGTMFRLLHECYHFCGERKRADRQTAFLKSLSANSAVIISNGLGDSLIENLEKDILKSLKIRFSVKDGEKIEEQCRQIVTKRIGEFQHNLELDLLQRMRSEFDKLSKETLYGRNLYPTAAEYLKNIIWNSGELEDEDSFLRDTYHKYLCCQVEVAEDLVSFLKGKSVPFSEANIWKESSTYKLVQEKNNEFDREEEQLIRAILGYYTDGNSFETGLVNIESEVLMTMEEVIGNLQDLFKECFADCMAAEILKLPVEDFILCFLYETWICEKAFPDTFRIAIELKVCYGIQGKLGKSVRRKIEGKVQHWEQNGFKYQRHGDDYMERVCDWLDKLLVEYEGTEKHHYVGIKHVEEYLQNCLDFYKGKCFKDVEEASHLTNMNSVKDTYQLLKKVTGAWQDIAKEGKD